MMHPVSLWRQSELLAQYNNLYLEKYLLNGRNYFFLIMELISDIISASKVHADAFSFLLTASFELLMWFNPNENMACGCRSYINLTHFSSI